MQLPQYWSWGDVEEPYSGRLILDRGMYGPAHWTIRMWSQVRSYAPFPGRQIDVLGVDFELGLRYAGPAVCNMVRISPWTASVTDVREELIWLGMGPLEAWNLSGEPVDLLGDYRKFHGVTP